MNTKLLILYNTYTRAYIAEFCYSPSGFLSALKNNELSEYKCLGKYNKHWEIKKQIDGEGDLDTMYRLKNYLTKHHMMIELWLLEPNPLQEFKRLYPNNEEKIFTKRRS